MAFNFKQVFKDFHAPYSKLESTIAEHVKALSPYILSVSTSSAYVAQKRTILIRVNKKRYTEVPVYAIRNAIVSAGCALGIDLEDYGMNASYWTLTQDNPECGTVFVNLRFRILPKAESVPSATANRIIG